jgi:DNA polymerase elongation subunit (family B)
MAYQNACYQRTKNIVHIWDDKHGHLQIPYKKYAYKKNAHGKYTALDGSKLEKVTSWDDSDIDRNLMYESDINPVTRTLIDMYYETDDMSDGHRELFFDIEVSTEGGYAKPDNPWQPLTSISFHDRAAKISVAIIIDKENKIKPYTDSDLILEVVSSEMDLINKFLTYYIEIRPTILSGWNIDFFDIPYLYNRISNVAGKQFADMLSPIGEVEFLKHRNMYKILGVTSYDYMYLYKLFTQNEEVSYALDAISKKELGHGKLEYEGTLDTLYKTDIEKYVKYNITDVTLVLELEEKLKYISLARGICHKGHVTYEEIYQTTRYLDGACLVYMKRLGIIAPNRKKHQHSEDEDDDSNDFEGAFVKDPIPGLYEWTFDEDMAALYPNAMRTLNISPETKIGRIDNWDAIKTDFYNENFTSAVAKLRCGSKHQLINVSQLREWLTISKYSVTSIGVVYDLDKKGLVPSILEAWSNEREEFRGLAKKYGKEGNKELSEFFDNRQQVAKRMNNSLYGALGAPGFRFHDLDNAESITMCGQDVVKNAMAKGNEWFVKQLGVSKDYVIYVDTDSTFFSAKPLIELMEAKFGRPLLESEKADLTFKTSQVVENYINASWDEFVQFRFNVTKHYFSIKQEYVAAAGFWIARKRYAQLIISEKGVSIKDMTNGAKEWKLDVKGMDVIRSDFPKAFRASMSDILINILQKAPKSVIDDKVIAIREGIKTAPLLDIMSPTGVKDVGKWKTKKAKGEVFAQRIKGTPIHVKSALNYNDLLDYYNSNHLPISDGDKIKWVYLKRNNLGLDTCALKGFEDPEEILKFISANIDYEKIFESKLQNKLDDFYGALNYGAVPKDKNIEEFFSF